MSKSKLIAFALLAVSCRSDEALIRASTQAYAKSVAAMDEARIASMFAPDGEIEVPQRDPVRGPENIRHYLEGFRTFHVLSEELTADKVMVRGATANSTGAYHQRVQLPDRKTIEVHGRYVMEWTKGADGVWRIAKLATVASQNPVTK